MFRRMSEFEEAQEALLGKMSFFELDYSLASAALSVLTVIPAN